MKLCAYCPSIYRGDVGRERDSIHTCIAILIMREIIGKASNNDLPPCYSMVWSWALALALAVRCRVLAVTVAAVLHWHWGYRH